TCALPIFAIRAGDGGRLTERTLPDEVDIGREFSRYLVAKLEAELQVAEASADIAARNVLREEIEFAMRLGDQFLRDGQVEALFETQREVALRRKKGGRFRFEEIGSEPRHAGGKIGFPVRLEILPDTGEHVPEGMHVPAVEQLKFRFLCLTVLHFAFRPEPEPLG